MKDQTVSFGRRQIRGLNKLGDAYVPGDEDLPSFSRLGCGNKIQQVTCALPLADQKDLKLLLTILSFLPAIMVGVLVKILERSVSWPDLLGGALLRFMQLGIKGLVMTLYWGGFKSDEFSGTAPLDFIGFHVEVARD